MLWHLDFRSHMEFHIAQSFLGVLVKLDALSLERQRAQPSPKKAQGTAHSPPRRRMEDLNSLPLQGWVFHLKIHLNFLSCRWEFFISYAPGKIAKKKTEQRGWKKMKTQFYSLASLLAILKSLQIPAPEAANLESQPLGPRGDPKVVSTLWLCSLATASPPWWYLSFLACLKGLLKLYFSNQSNLEAITKKKKYIL